MVRPCQYLLKLACHQLISLQQPLFLILTSQIQPDDHAVFTNPLSQMCPLQYLAEDDDGLPVCLSLEPFAHETHFVSVPGSFVWVLCPGRFYTCKSLALFGHG
jgi:hypothetical protein